MRKKQKIIVIVGPTASGKSDLAVRLAKKFDCEVISADSRQVYSGLNIGTGKITKREMRGVSHYLLDVASPRRTFTAHDFVRLASKAMEDISKRGKIPIIAGGTGFYIDALIGRISLPEVPPDKTLRAKLEQKTPAQLLAQLRRKDPKRAAVIIKKGEQNNKRRLIRAIEIAQKFPTSIKGSPPCGEGSLMNSHQDPSYEVLWIGIAPKPEELREKIHTRLVARLKRGMATEARRLHEKGLSWKRMEELGLEYRYLARFLRGQIIKEKLIEQLAAKIWQYSRRQITYWRRNKNIKWFKPNEYTKIKRLVSSFLGV